MGLLKSLLGGGHHGGHHGYNRGHGGPVYDAGVPAASALAGAACPSCRAMNATGARFCQNCGASLAPRACTQCGTNLAMNAKFCGQCGNQAS